MALLILSMLLAVVHWYAVIEESRWLIYITKPAMMVALLAWVWTTSDLPRLISIPGAFSLLWFVLGLAFSLLGDVLLMLPDRFFPAGLVAFLVGHVFYILGFGRLLPPPGAYLVAIFLVVVVAAVSFWVVRRLFAGMEASGKTRLKVPVGIYALVISVMLFTAFLRLLDGNWATTYALFVGLGALLFYVSDVMNAWVRFVGPISMGRFKIMATYHVAQIGLAVGATLHFVQYA
jgi:uncharacterized membrane protein YhhN